MTTLSSAHKERFTAIRKELTLAGCRESSFIHIELLFYEALTIARTYGNDPAGNPLLQALKQLEAGPYHLTKELFKKSSMRERVIKKFIVQFKNLLSRTTSNLLVPPVAKVA